MSPRFVDLTLTLTEGMRGFSSETACTIESHGWNATNLHLYSHAGTHMDAPQHYAVSNETIDQIPLSECQGAAWVVNLTPVAPKALLTVAHLGKVSEHLSPGESLLLRTDWSQYIREPQYRDALPRVSVELARWCVAKQVRILGVEPPAVADPHNRAEVTEVHQILLSGGVRIVEGLTNLNQLMQERVFFAAFPLKWQMGDGAPCRAFAVEGVSPEGWQCRE
jgi:kynurenine formamidase